MVFDTDNERKNSKKILVDMLDKAIDSDLLIKNAAKQVNTVISKENSRLPRMPENAVLSRVCWILVKRQMYRNLSQIGVISRRNGVVNGVVDCS